VIYLIALVILVTEAAKVREHLWASVTHEHWAKRPLVPSVPASDAFHLASALSHGPIVLCLLWMSGASWWEYLWIMVAAQVLWWQAKMSNGREWPNKFKQIKKGLEKLWTSKRN